MLCQFIVESIACVSPPFIQLRAITVIGLVADLSANDISLAKKLNELLRTYMKDDEYVVS